jgi:uncharacterized protein DUF4242
MCRAARCPNVGPVRHIVAAAITEQERETMKRYVIEREIPGASELSQEELAAIAGKSNDVVESLGVPYRWITSYVAGNKIYCVHEADDEDAIREHARRGGFPANSISVIANEFGPHTAASTTTH